MHAEWKKPAVIPPNIDTIWRVDFLSLPPSNYEIPPRASIWQRWLRAHPLFSHLIRQFGPPGRLNWSASTVIHTNGWHFKLKAAMGERVNGRCASIESSRGTLCVPGGCHKFERLDLNANHPMSFPLPAQRIEEKIRHAMFLLKLDD